MLVSMMLWMNKWSIRGLSVGGPEKNSPDVFLVLFVVWPFFPVDDMYYIYNTYSLQYMLSRPPLYMYVLICCTSYVQWFLLYHHSPHPVLLESLPQDALQILESMPYHGVNGDAPWHCSLNEDSDIESKKHISCCLGFTHLCLKCQLGSGRPSPSRHSCKLVRKSVRSTMQSVCALAKALEIHVARS